MLILVIGLLLIAAAISYLKFGSIDPSELTAVNIHEGQASFPTYWIPYAILATRPEMLPLRMKHSTRV